MKLLPLLSLIAAVSAHLPLSLLKRQTSYGTTTTIPSTPITGDVLVNLLSKATNLDGPQISGVNLTSWDWWYFDAISPDLNSSISIVFFNALSTGFPNLPPNPNPNVIVIYYTFPNGTSQAIPLSATEAVVTTNGNGASGDWKTSGATFTGTPDLKYYSIKIDTETISGTFKLVSRAPAHYPCGPAKEGVSMEVVPNIGWSNAIPDGDADVDFAINGDTTLKFEGAGYHDKNWSGQFFPSNVASWYWGHGRLGPYQIVWFSTLTPSSNVEGSEYVSAYVSKNGKLITASCAPNSAKVRPDTAYPPTQSTPQPTAFSLELDLGHEGILSVNVTTHLVLLNGPPSYIRWSGSMEGKVRGEELKSGYALYEQFREIAE